MRMIAPVIVINNCILVQKCYVEFGFFKGGREGITMGVVWELGWRSGESTRFPSMWPGFDSRTRHHMWVEFVVGSRPCSVRFFSGYSGFPLSSKTNISKFQFDLDSVSNALH